MVLACNTAALSFNDLNFLVNLQIRECQLSTFFFPLEGIIAKCFLFSFTPGRELASITWITTVTREGTNHNGYVNINGYVTM